MCLTFVRQHVAACISSMGPSPGESRLCATRIEPAGRALASRPTVRAAALRTSRLGQIAAIVGGMLVIAAIGLLDWWTGIHLAFSPFYLAPIAVAAWRCAPCVTYSLVAASTLVWYGAEHVWDQGLPGWVSLWNAATRVLIFGVVAALIVRMRRQADHLVEANLCLQELLQHEQEISRKDSLTDLANRRAFHDALADVVVRSQRDGRRVSIAMLDLDNFKQVNDGYGHEAGDGLLRRVSAGLVSAVRRGDLVARLGGDEFGVLFADADAEVLARIADRLVAVVEQASRSWPAARVGVSVGLVTFIQLPLDPDLILREVDRLMYRSKREGKGRVTASVIRGVGPDGDQDTIQSQF